MRQMALRACKVIKEQSDFTHLNQVNKFSRNGLRAREPLFTGKIDDYLLKCEFDGITNESPRLNEFHEEFSKIDNFGVRKRYIKACTDNLLLRHLYSKGWLVSRGEEKCRFNSCSALKETLEHIVVNHGEQLTQVAEFKKLVCRERKRGTKRAMVAMPGRCARELAETFKDIPEPYLRLRLRDGHGSGGNASKRRRKDPHPPPSSDSTDQEMARTRPKNYRKNRAARPSLARDSVTDDRQGDPQPAEQPAQSGTRTRSSVRAQNQAEEESTNPTTAQLLIASFNETAAVAAEADAALAASVLRQQNQAQTSDRVSSIPVIDLPQNANNIPSLNPPPISEEPPAPTRTGPITRSMSKSRSISMEQSSSSITTRIAGRLTVSDKPEINILDIEASSSSSSPSPSTADDPTTGSKQCEAEKEDASMEMSVLAFDEEMDTEEQQLVNEIDGKEEQAQEESASSKPKSPMTGDERMLAVTKKLAFNTEFKRSGHLFEEDKKRVPRQMAADDAASSTTALAEQLINKLKQLRKNAQQRRNRAITEDLKKAERSAEAALSLRLNRLFCRIKAAREETFQVETLEERQKAFREKTDEYRRARKLANNKRRKEDKAVERAKTEAEEAAKMKQATAQRPKSSRPRQDDGQSSSRSSKYLPRPESSRQRLDKGQSSSSKASGSNSTSYRQEQQRSPRSPRRSSSRSSRRSRRSPRPSPRRTPSRSPSRQHRSSRQSPGRSPRHHHRSSRRSPSRSPRHSQRSPRRSPRSTRPRSPSSSRSPPTPAPRRRFTDFPFPRSPSRSPPRRVRGLENFGQLYRKPVDRLNIIDREMEEMREKAEKISRDLAKKASERVFYQEKVDRAKERERKEKERRSRSPPRAAERSSRREGNESRSQQDNGESVLRGCNHRERTPSSSSSIEIIEIPRLPKRAFYMSSVLQDYVDGKIIIDGITKDEARQKIRRRAEDVANRDPKLQAEIDSTVRRGPPEKKKDSSKKDPPKRSSIFGAEDIRYDADGNRRPEEEMAQSSSRSREQKTTSKKTKDKGKNRSDGKSKEKDRRKSRDRDRDDRSKKSGGRKKN